MLSDGEWMHEMQGYLNHPKGAISLATRCNGFDKHACIYHFRETIGRELLRETIGLLAKPQYIVARAQPLENGPFRRSDCPRKELTRSGALVTALSTSVCIRSCLLHAPLCRVQRLHLHAGAQCHESRGGIVVGRPQRTSPQDGPRGLQRLVRWQGATAIVPQRAQARARAQCTQEELGTLVG